MPAVELIVFRVTTPDEQRIFRTLPPAVEWQVEQLLRYGWIDGWKACIEQVVERGELPEDTDWLERALGRETEAAG